MSLLSVISGIATGGVSTVLGAEGKALQNGLIASKLDLSKGIGAVAATYSNILTNIGSGSILSPSAAGNTGSPIVNKIITAASSPLGIGASMAALIGAGVVVSSVVGAAKAGQVGGAVGAAGATAATQIKPPVQPTESNPSTLPKTIVPPKTDIPNSIPNPSDDLPKGGGISDGNTGIPKTTVEPAPKATDPPKQGTTTSATPSGGDIIGKVEDLGKKALQTSLTDNSNKNTSTPGGADSATTKKTKKKKITKRKTTSKAKPSKARKVTTKRKSSKSERYKAPSRYGSGKQYSRKGGKTVHYTKNGQPYIIMASGKAKFIKR